MGHLTGYTYRHIANSLKRLHFKFDRQAAGSHEIWFNEGKQVYTTTPRHPGEIPEKTVIHILTQAGISIDDFLSHR